MAHGIKCKCGQTEKWAVLQRKCNHSAFNGGHYTPSDYSSIICQGCGRVWRTKAKYVDTLPNFKG